jgi:hypothetical protein
MKLRKYINQTPIYQYTNNRGCIFAYNVHAENTRLHLIERLQGPGRYDGQRWEQIIFTIEFIDTGLICTSKAKNTYYEDNESLYTNYALDLMEHNTYEEYYKVALLITKNRLQRSINGFENAEKEYKKTGYWPYPFNTDPSMYRRSYNLDKKTHASIDITEKDLKFIDNYKQP